MGRTGELEEKHGRTLLWVARESICRHLQGRSLPAPRGVEDALGEPRGAFVTLRKGRALRGCLGRVERSHPLWQVVRDMAGAAATRDSRFEKVHLDEMPRIALEVSVLSGLRRVRGPAEIRIGEHGVFLRKGDRTGLLLPQVAVEQGWGPEDLLDRTCRKARLPPGAWREGAEIHVFGCQVFEDPVAQR